MYSKTKRQVFASGKLSGSFQSHVGLMQGDSLSPLLFSLFVNDLEAYLSEHGFNPINLNFADINLFIKLFIILYADDLAMVSESSENLQIGLNHLNNYARTWKLQVNIKKTKVSVFGVGNPDVSFEFDGKVIDIVDSFTYLGVNFTSDGSFKSQVSRVRDQGRKAMFLLLSKGRQLQLSLGTYLQLFEKMVLPVLTYGCEVWGFEKLDVLDKLQLEFIRYVLKLNKCTPIAMLYAESGILPISTVVKGRMLKFYQKLGNPVVDTLSSLVFMFVQRMDRQVVFKSKWFKCIRDIFIDLGDIVTYNNQTILQDTYVRWARLQLRDVFIGRCMARISSLPKCELYIMFKHTFGAEHYLMALPPDLAVSLCKFRTSNHKLEIERLRYGPNRRHRNERYCSKCTGNELGNEYHHVIYCEAFRGLREKYIPRYYCTKPNLVKFLDLIKKEGMAFRLAKFLKESQKGY